MWLAAAKISSGRIFRAIRKNGKVWGTGLDEQESIRFWGVRRLSQENISLSLAVISLWLRPMA
jgi:hypothetical protein